MVEDLEDVKTLEDFKLWLRRKPASVHSLVFEHGANGGFMSDFDNWIAKFKTEYYATSWEIFPTDFAPHLNDLKEKFLDLWDWLFRISHTEELPAWESELYKLSCTCKDFYLAWRVNNPEADLVKFESKWALKTSINQKLNKPNLTLEEALNVYGISKPINQNRNDIVAVTSISTKKHSIEHQRRCIRTWNEFGLTVYAKNTTSEIEEVREFFPGVTFIECNEVSTDYDYPTQLIRNLAITAIDLGLPVLLINSDVQLRGKNELLQFDEQNQFVGIRWNYENERPYVVSEFRYGLDAFSFTPNQARLIPPDFPYGIGQAMWDYAIPAVSKLNGVSLNIVHTPLLFHKNHVQNWNEKGWHFGKKWLLNRLGVNVEYGTPKYRDSLELPGWEYKNFRFVQKGS